MSTRRPWQLTGSLGALALVALLASSCGTDAQSPGGDAGNSAAGESEAGGGHAEAGGAHAGGAGGASAGAHSAGASGAGGDATGESGAGGAATTAGTGGDAGSSDIAGAGGTAGHSGMSSGAAGGSGGTSGSAGRGGSAGTAGAAVAGTAGAAAGGAAGTAAGGSSGSSAGAGTGGAGTPPLSCSMPLGLSFAGSCDKVSSEHTCFEYWATPTNTVTTAFVQDQICPSLGATFLAGHCAPAGDLLGCCHQSLAHAAVCYYGAASLKSPIVAACPAGPIDAWCE